MPDYSPIYLSINNKPRAILATMDELRARHQKQKIATGKVGCLPWLLVLLGLPFIALDFVLGYDAWLFAYVGIGCMLAGLLAGWLLGRNRLDNELPPRYEAAQTVIHTLRDDLDPKRNFFGHLDLTGAEQPSKLANEGSNSFGLETGLYRDEWLNLRSKLYDGNMLRLAAIERVKVRKGYYKRSRISGKQKWKVPKYKNLQELKIRLSVNPNIYDIKADPGAFVGKRVGQYTINQLSTSGGILQMSASANSTVVESSDILSVLHLVYSSMLQRKVNA